MNRYFRIVKGALRVMLLQKSKAVLAMLGVAIGIAAVIIMVAIGNGAQQDILEQIQQNGTNVLVINAGKKETLAGRANQTRQITTLNLKDQEALIENIDTEVLKAIAPVQEGGKQVKYGSLFTNATVIGTNPSYFDIKNYHLEDGRCFDEDENTLARRVAVIGNQIKTTLFKDVDPIGERIKIGGVMFEIIGVLQSKGSTAQGSNEDTNILIPLKTAFRRVFNVNYLANIYVQVHETDQLVPTKTIIEEILRETHRLERLNKSDDFIITNQIRALEAQRETARNFSMLIAGVAGLSLLVGGAGILAVMLLSVKERSREIGLKMAVGAKPFDIVLQFLSESMVLGIFGGAIGIMIGVSVAMYLDYFTENTAIVSISSIIFSFLFTFVIGIVFGVYPARKAAQLDPILALNGK
ncbi:MAG: peptide ABC transporter permease [Bacteroidetes bacterium]|nr:MAG: peptide ABC transporter permease [Bacteroidota bacterium]